MKNKKYLYVVATALAVAVMLLIGNKIIPQDKPDYSISTFDYLCLYLALPTAYVTAPALLAYLLPSLKSRKIAIVCLIAVGATIAVYAIGSIANFTVAGNNIPMWFIVRNNWCFWIAGVLLTIGVNGLKGEVK